MLSLNEYASLCETLSGWAKAYAAGNPVVSDEVYDANYVKLKEFEANNPSFILDTSPTRHVEDGATGFRKVVHEIPMISIDDAHGIDATREWAEKMFAAGVKQMELEYKLDGVSLALKYKGGHMLDSITRGQDNVGDSVFENALRVKGVHHTITLPGDIEIRGETVLKYDDFYPLNEKREAEGKKPFANPRAGATGTLKTHDPDEVEGSNLSFVAYLIVKGSPRHTHDEDIELLKNMGFEVPEHHVVDNIEDLVRVAEEMRSRRYELPYPIDGIVLKVNDKDDQARFGITSKSPNYYKAYKFPPEEKVTTLRGIRLSMGMHGAVTPVALFDPVELAMTTVRQSTIHNWDIVEYMGLFEGCHITVRKSGDIIPEVVGCVETGRTADMYEAERSRCDRLKISHVDPWVPSTDAERQYKRYLRPVKCPECGSELHCQVNSEGKELIAWVCENADCKSQIGGKLVNFVSRNCMNIMGIGEKMVEQLMEAGKLKFFNDFYHLRATDIMEACGKREVEANKKIQAIEKSKDNYLHQLIEGFSIPGLGHQVAPAIAEGVRMVGGFGRLFTYQIEDGKSFDEDFRRAASELGVSDKLANEFLMFICNNIHGFRDIVSMKVAQKIKEAKSAKLAGKVCIMTGTFDRLEREVFKEMVTANGGTICSSITKKCNLVLMGDGAGPSKVQKIDELRRAGQLIDVYTPETLDKFLALLD